jgi:hypothetical protein
VDGGTRRAGPGPKPGGQSWHIRAFVSEEDEMNKLIPVVIACLLCTAARGQPSVSVYYDETSFTAATNADAYLAELDDFPEGMLDALSMGSPSGYQYTVRAVAPPGPWEPSLWGLPDGLSTLNSTDTIEISFTGAPVTAVGGLFWVTDMEGAPVLDGANILVTLADGTSQQVVSSDPASFLGFTSSEPIASIRVSAPAPAAGECLWPTMAHVYAGAVRTDADSIAPTISGISVSPAVIAAKNHKMVPVTVTYTATDGGGPLTSALTISSNQPPQGGGNARSSADWQVVDAHHVLLRAERIGSAGDRVYTITIACTDQAGNTSAATAKVTVPHDK